MRHDNSPIQPSIHTPALSPYGAMPPFYAMELLEQARELERNGRTVFHFEIGEPSLPTPAPIVDAAIAALQASRTRYTPSMGLSRLRQALSNSYSNEYGVTVSPDRFAVSSGTSPLLWQALALLLRPGDEVILLDPYYPSHRAIAEAIGARVTLIPCEPEQGFVPNTNTLLAAISTSTRLVLLGSPGNPTGARIDAQVIAEIAKRVPWVLVDEIYRGISYDGNDQTCLLCDAPNVLVADGFSKRFAMTGWRLGYLVVPEPLLRPLQSMQQNLMISANHFVQEAAIIALTDPHVAAENKRRCSLYRQWRDHLHGSLSHLGLRVQSPPDGAFYLMVQRPWGLDSVSSARELLERTGIAVAPGRDFGVRADRFWRFSFLQPPEIVNAAMAALATVL